MINTNNSAQLHIRRFHYSAILLTASVIVVMMSVFAVVWPYLDARLEAWYHPILTLCGCDQFIRLPDQPSLFVVMMTVLLLFMTATMYSLSRLVTTLWRTMKYRQYLHNHSTSTTYCQGIAIHQVDVPETVALCIGYFHPEIFISRPVKQVLQPFELWAVIRHELSHAVNRDPLHRLLMTMIRPLFPLFRRQFERYFAWQELVADEYVSDDSTIRQALVKLVSVQETQPHVSATWFSTTNVRISRLLGDQIDLPNIWPILIVTVVISLVLLTSSHAFAQAEQTTAYGQCENLRPMCEALMSYARP